MTRKEILGYLGTDNPGGLFEEADRVRRKHCGDVVHIRGIVEFSSHCVRNCLYCGLRRDNRDLRRYRMEPEEVMNAVASVAAAGIRTVVLQSGDDLSCPQESLVNIIRETRRRHPEMAITLSVGERPFSDYRAFREAGADRYLLKHETACRSLYQRLHPGQSFDRRRRILAYLRELGYQVGCGNIVGLPGQTAGDLVEDILFLQEFQPDMAGIGPFLPQSDTPLSGFPAGDIGTALRMIALARIVTPNAFLPSTTALATRDPENGLTKGIQSGANVIMLDFTPEAYRKDYRIYDDRVPVTLRKAEGVIRRAGRTMSLDRGDSLKNMGEDGSD